MITNVEYAGHEGGALIAQIEVRGKKQYGTVTAINFNTKKVSVQFDDMTVLGRRVTQAAPGETFIYQMVRNLK